MLNTKDLFTLIIGLLFSLFAGIAYNYIVGFSQINIIFSLIGILAFFILGVAWIISKRIKETEERIEGHEKDQRRLEEKLKIHEQLIDIKKDIELLKEKRLKNNER